MALIMENIQHATNPRVHLSHPVNELAGLAARVIINDARRLFHPNPVPIDDEGGGGGDGAQAQPMNQHDVEMVLRETEDLDLVPVPELFYALLDGDRYPTSILPIRANPMDDISFVQILIAQKDTLVEVDLTGCKSIQSRDLLDELAANRDNLPRLVSLTTDAQPFMNSYADLNYLTDDKYVKFDEFGMLTREESAVRQMKGDVHFTQFFPELRTLKFSNMDSFNSEKETRPDFLLRIIEPLKGLDTLEIKDSQNLGDLRFLRPLADHLTSLTLHNCPDVVVGLEALKRMRRLVHLDISQLRPADGRFHRPVSTLFAICDSMPQLRYLDISNTNLCANASPDDRPERRFIVDTDIRGLEGLHHTLDFLGVFHCDNITPSTKFAAKVVCSEVSEQHLLVSLQTYMDRVEMLHAVLNELYQIYRQYTEEDSANADYAHGLELILRAMRKHRTSRALQVSATASIFYIIRNANLSAWTKRCVIEAMLDSVETFADETVTVRNCCLAFCQLDIPADVVFCYKRLIEALLRVLNSHFNDVTTPRVVAYLLNSMACHVEGEHKVAVGTFGAIDAVVAHIKRRLRKGNCDEVMEVCWSFLWNVTDETPLNCELFLRADGIELFLWCRNEFPDRRELVRNMMGLIGNIAEVDYLRRHLMTDEMIKIFTDLLELITDGIETSYNAAGVLAQLLSDGPDKWTVEVKREAVIGKVVQATESWNLDSRRFINYRSFRPILRLLPIWESYGSQIWALWALANLTTTDGEKYCNFVIREDGMPLLEALYHDDRCSTLMRSLVYRVLHNVSIHCNIPAPQLIETDAAAQPTTASTDEMS